MKIRPTSLRSRLLSVVLLTFLPLLTLTLYTASEVRALMIQGAQEEALALASRASDTEARLLESTEGLLRSAARVLEFGGMTRCDELLGEISRGYSGISRLAVADLDGDLVCSSQPLTAAVNVADRPWFTRTLAANAFSVGDYAIGRITGRALLIAGYPVFGEDGEVQRIVGAGIDLEWLDALSSETDLPKGATLTLVDGGGVVLAQSPDDGVGAAFADRDLFAEVVREGDGSLTVVHDGAPQLVSFRRLAEDSNVWVLVSLPRAAILSEADAIFLQNVLGLLLVFAVILGLVWWRTERALLRPLESFTKGTERVATGDLSARLPTASYVTELQRLARSFNRMGDALESQRAHTERETRERERISSLFQAIFRAIPDAVVFADPDRRISLTNPAFATVFGYVLNEVQGRTTELLYADPKDYAAQGRIRYHRRSEGESVYELEYRHRSGGVFVGETVGTAVKGADGELLGFLGIVRDVSERKVREEALKHYAEELQRSNAELERFAYVASHDLQEPLRVVAGYTQLLARRYRGKLDRDADEFIAFAVDGVTRMQALIRDLLTYSRAGKGDRAFEPVDLETLLQTVLGDLKFAIEDASATVTHDALPTVSGDATALRQLLQNLIANAVKFRGDAPPRVHLSACRTPSSWRLSVRDNGVGIDPKHAERVFGVFQRLHTREEYEGTGIGLALCRRIVERHGGEIWFESSVGEGATFYLTLPLKG